MVGEFGEVQVMDWGLAKELSRAEPAATTGGATEEETVARAEEAMGLTRAGVALGTPSYMPPEQAAGDWDIVDERADVFALGAILCQALTGRPPYHGAGRDDLLRLARRGALAEALGSLENCGADAALVSLCRDCLAATREVRPRHAGVVAERVANYRVDLEARLRRAELEKAAETARAEEATTTALVMARAKQAKDNSKQIILFLATCLVGILLAGVAVLVLFLIVHWRNGDQTISELERIELTALWFVIILMLNGIFFIGNFVFLFAGLVFSSLYKAAQLVKLSLRKRKPGPTSPL
jgi:hypothetical protein